MLTKDEEKILDDYLDLVDIYGEACIGEWLRIRANKKHVPVPRMVRWSDEELTLLADMYPRFGTRIPELREKFTAKQISNRASLLGLKYDGYANLSKSMWSEYQLAVLHREYPKHGADIPELLQFFNRQQIITKAYREGLKFQHAWQDYEDELLRKYYPEEGTFIPELLKTHSAAAIVKRANKLGLQNDKHSRVIWSHDEVEALVVNYREHGFNIPILLKKFTERQITAKALSLGLVQKKGKPRSTFTEEEIALLIKEYPKYGTDIPELLKKHSTATITRKANSLGLYFDASLF